MRVDRAKDWMALADISKNGTGVVNKEHEYPLWAARGDPAFSLDAYGTPPPSVDRLFDLADWLGDPRHGINETAAQRLGLGDIGREFLLAMDATGDGVLDATELTARAPADMQASKAALALSPRPAYIYTPANAAALASAGLRAFGTPSGNNTALDGDGAARYAVAVAYLRGGNATATADARRLVAALVQDFKNGASGRTRNVDWQSKTLAAAANAIDTRADWRDGALTDRDVAAYERAARASGAMAVAPAGPGNPANWFIKATGGKHSVPVVEFVERGRNA